METITLAGLVALIVFILIVLYLSVRLVNQYERMVVFRLGKTGPELVREPGLNFLIPIVDRPVKVDIRETFIEIPSQTAITKDNAPINIDFLIYWYIVDPLQEPGERPVLRRRAAGHRDDHSPRGHRRHPSRRRAIKARADQRGPAVEARRADRALGRQGDHRRDPRDRRATRRPGRDEPPAVGRAQPARGDHRVRRCRQANINVAEGEKQANILRAEGRRQSSILEAEGFSQALERIFAAAHLVDERTMTLQYLEALKALGASPSTKFVIPLEFVELATRISGYAEKALGAGSGGTGPTVTAKVGGGPATPGGGSPTG